MNQSHTKSSRFKALRFPIGIFLLSTLVLSLFSFQRVTKPSTDPHFAYLAMTLNSMILEGMGNEKAIERRKNLKAFELEKNPPHGNDWASYEEIQLKNGEQLRGTWFDKQGKGRFRLLTGEAMILGSEELQGAKRQKRYFMSFPPGPSFVMMPLVAISGYKTNDVILTILFAAFNITFMFLLLELLREKEFSVRTTRENLWLTLLFGLGSAHFWLSVMGQVWFTALVMGASFTLLYLYFGISARRPFWAGVFAAMAFATRTPLLFATLLFYLFVLFPDGKFRKEGWPEAFKKVIWFSIPCVLMGAFLLYANYLRFESLTEFGHRYLAGGALGRIKSYGLFNFHFLSKNLASLFTLVPRFQPNAPYVIISKHGMSLLFATPAFIYLLWPSVRESAREKFFFRAFWLTVFVIAIPHLLYQNTGYEQFSYRFSLDYTPFLIVLLAVGKYPMTRWFRAAILWGVGVNAFGAIVFKRFSQFFSNEFFP